LTEAEIIEMIYKKQLELEKIENEIGELQEQLNSLKKTSQVYLDECSG